MVPTDDGGRPPEDSEAGKTGGFDRREALQTATDKPCANLLADIVGHPEQLPSVEELTYMNPRMSRDAIRRQLNVLMSVGVVEERELPSGERRPDYPYRFYMLTPQARALFEDVNLFPRGAWHREYTAVEKSSRITKLETCLRPGR